MEISKTSVPTLRRVVSAPSTFSVRDEQLLLMDIRPSTPPLSPPPSPPPPLPLPQASFTPSTAMHSPPNPTTPQLLRQTPTPTQPLPTTPLQLDTNTAMLGRDPIIVSSPSNVLVHISNSSSTVPLLRTSSRHHACHEIMAPALRRMVSAPSTFSVRDEQLVPALRRVLSAPSIFSFRDEQLDAAELEHFQVVELEVEELRVTQLEVEELQVTQLEVTELEVEELQVTVLEVQEVTLVEVQETRVVTEAEAETETAEFEVEPQAQLEVQEAAAAEYEVESAAQLDVQGLEVQEAEAGGTQGQDAAAQSEEEDTTTFSIVNNPLFEDEDNEDVASTTFPRVDHEIEEPEPEEASAEPHETGASRIRVLWRSQSAPTIRGEHDRLSLSEEDVEDEDSRRKNTPWLSVLLCLLVGFSVGYLNALPGQLLGTDKFLRRVAPVVWHRLIHSDVNNYCAVFDARLQLLLASQHLVQIVAVFVAHYLCSRSGTRSTLLVGLVLMMLGTGLLTWLPGTIVAIAAFVILNLGIGAATRVVPFILSRNSLQQFSFLYDLGSWVGGFIPILFVFLTLKHQTWAWRVAYGAMGGLLFFIFTLSLFLVDTNRPGKTISFSFLLKRSNIPNLIIITVASTMTVFSGVGVLQFYGPLLFSSSNFSSKSLFTPPFVISLIQIMSRLVSIVVVRFRGRKDLLFVAALAKIVSEGVMTGIFRETSSRFTFFKDPRSILIPGCIYVAADACLTAPFGWLEMAFPEDVEEQGATVSIALGLLQNAVMSFVSVLAFCKLGGYVFSIFLVFDCIIICFILKLVPESNVDWSSHKIWGRFVRRTTIVV